MYLRERQISKTIIADTFMVSCNQVIYVMDIVSTNMTNKLSLNDENYHHIYYDDNKIGFKIYCYIIHMVLLVIIFYLKLSLFVMDL